MIIFIDDVDMTGAPGAEGGPDGVVLRGLLIGGRIAVSLFPLSSCCHGTEFIADAMIIAIAGGAEV